MINGFGPPEIFYLIRSLGWTLLLTVIAFGIGGLLGGIFALMRLSRLPVLRLIAAGYINVIQSIPVLMVLFLSYYGVALAGLDLPPLLAASASLAIYAGSYLAEIWRGAIEAVPRQQWEASESLAMSRAQQYRYVILPQAIAISLPPTAGFLVQLVKNTSIVSVVGFVDLTRAGQLINNATFEPFRVFGMVALLYFIICFPLSWLSKRFERMTNVSRQR